MLLNAPGSAFVGLVMHRSTAMLDCSMEQEWSAASATTCACVDKNANMPTSIPYDLQVLQHLCFPCQDLPATWHTRNAELCRSAYWSSPDAH